MCHALPAAPLRSSPSRTRMDLTATPQQEDLRAELRSWLAANLPWEYGTGLPPHFDDLAEEVAFLR